MPPPFQVTAKVTAQSDINDANIAVNGPNVSTFPQGADPTTRQVGIQTDDQGFVTFAFEVTCQFPGIVFSLTLTKAGETQPRYTSDPQKSITGLDGIGKDRHALVDFN